LKICLDTNILISGIFWKGLPGRIIDLWLENKFDSIVTPAILDEYQKTIRKIGAKINPALSETWVQIVTQKTSLLSVTPSKRRWSSDPDDDKFVQCSLEGQADYLVSGTVISYLCKERCR
jgi:putative PIN family toxin of toxin-antitoxin system